MCGTIDMNLHQSSLVTHNKRSAMVGISQPRAEIFLHTTHASRWLVSHSPERKYFYTPHTLRDGWYFTAPSGNIF